MPAKTHPVLRGQLELALPSLLSRAEVDDWRDKQTFVLDDGGVELTLRVYETYSWSGTDFRAAVAADLKTQGVTRSKLATLKVRDPLVAIEVVPILEKSFDRSVFIYGAYFARPAGTVQVLAFYLSTKAVREATDWIPIARKIARSAKPAKSDVEIRETARILSNDITAFPGWVITGELTPMSKGWVEIHMQEVIELGGQGAHCRVQLHGGDSITPRGNEPVTTVRGNTELFTVTWTEWTDARGPITEVTEAFIPGSGKPVPGAGHDHATCRAPDKNRLASLREMVEKIRFR